MAELSDLDRKALWADFMRQASKDGETIAVTKADLRAAVDGLDTWLNDNAAAANNAIPQPARSGLTTTQKALLLMYVVQKRYVAEV